MMSVLTPEAGSRLPPPSVVGWATRCGPALGGVAAGEGSVGWVTLQPWKLMLSSGNGRRLDPRAVSSAGQKFHTRDRHARERLVGQRRRKVEGTRNDLDLPDDEARPDQRVLHAVDGDPVQR